MKFFLLPPLEEILKKREEKIKDILRQADKMSSQAERIEKNYQQYIDEAHRFSARVLQTAHNDVAKDREKQEKLLLNSLKSDLLAVEENVTSEKKRVYRKLRAIMSNFINSFLRVSFSVLPDEKTLKKEVAKNVKERFNV
jgi:F0F1-type ATP synthase membrane subunit b/b'